MGVEHAIQREIPMILLQHPTIKVGEGPNAYLMRLSEANFIQLSDLKHIGVCIDKAFLKSMCCADSAFDLTVERYIDRLQTALEKQQSSWNRLSCRFCPLCLLEKAYWPVTWELLLFDVCPTHGCWLVDRCDQCGSNLTWSREKLATCDCGHHLASHDVADAPSSVKALVNELHRKFMGLPDAGEIPVLKDLNFEQCTRLVRFLGAYGDSAALRRPQKIRNAGAMDVSWQITSTASEILSHWPESFHQMLHGMLDRSTESIGQKFPVRFGFFYSLLYRRFGEVEFASVRSAFEDFVALHWRGPIARRNTRLSDALLKRAAWVPANYARRQLQVSSSRLTELVRSGALVGEERVSEKGRRFMVVQKDSMMAMLPSLEDEIDLSRASEILGLTKARLRSALPLLFPNARKIEGEANRWAISRAEVESFLNICSVPDIPNLSEGQVSVDHILRFWCCSEDEITRLLVCFKKRELEPLGRLGPSAGLSRLVFHERQVRELVDLGRDKNHDKWTIPQVAEMLAVKQEVVYFLVRRGMLASYTRVIGRREAALVDREGLDAFHARYVFARDLAKMHKTSSRGLQSRLAKINIHPAVPSLLGACRQVIYEQTPELQALSPIGA